MMRSSAVIGFSRRKNNAMAKSKFAWIVAFDFPMAADALVGQAIP